MEDAVEQVIAAPEFGTDLIGAIESRGWAGGRNLECSHSWRDPRPLVGVSAGPHAPLRSGGGLRVAIRLQKPGRRELA